MNNDSHLIWSQLNIEKQALGGNRYAIKAVVNALRFYRAAAKKVISDEDLGEFKKIVEKISEDIGDN